MQRTQTITPFLFSGILHLGLIGALYLAATRPLSEPAGLARAGSSLVFEVTDGSRTAAQRAVPSIRSAPPKKPVADAIVTGAVQSAAVRPSASVPETPSIDPTASADSLGVAGGVRENGPLGVEGGQQASARDRYIYELTVFLNGRKIYPRLALQRREGGDVQVRFRIHRDGSISEPELERLSAYPRLNEAALKLVQDIGRFRPFPDGVSAESMRIAVPIKYVLREFD